MKEGISPLVTAIVVSYNNREWLGKCIPTLKKQTYKHLEIIVVDNASVDNAREYIQQRFPKIKVVEQRENLGFGAGVNAGIREAKGEYLIIAVTRGGIPSFIALLNLLFLFSRLY